MKWTRRIQTGVDRADLNKGHDCFKSGAVRIQSGDSGKVVASVDDSTPHPVAIRVDSDAVVVSCDCVRFQKRGRFCGHIWGTLLAAESGGYLNRIAAMWDPYLEHALESETPASGNSEAAVDSSAFDFIEDKPEPASPPSVSRKKKPAQPKIPEWKEHLSVLRQVSNVRDYADPDESRRVLYFVNVSDCVAAGTLVVRSVVCRMKKDGTWGRPNFQESWIRNVAQLDASDQKLLSLLSPSLGSNGISYSQTDTASTWNRLSRAVLDVVMPLLCATERFFLTTLNEPDDHKLLKWDDGCPFIFRMSIDRDESSQQYIIKGHIRRGDENLSLAEPALLVSGLVIFPDRVARFNDGGAFEWVSFFRKHGRLIIPQAHRTDFVAEIAKFRELPPLEFPDELRIEPRSFAGPPQLTIRPVRERWSAQQRLECDITFDYGVKVAESDLATAIHDQDRFFSRDRTAETKAVQRLVDLGVRRVSAWNRPGSWELAPGRLPVLVQTLVTEGWRVEAEGKLYRRPGNFKIDVTSGIDWFEVRGAADFEGQTVALPELLKAVKRGEKMILLGDGSYGLVPEDWLKRYGLIGGFGKEEDGQIRFTRGQAGLLDALLASQPEVTFDEGFLRVRRELETFAGVEAQDATPEFNGTLRDYQKDGLGWLHFVRRFGFGGCLADDMGLGKTVQVLALLASEERRGPALVVAPRSLIFNWKQEAARFARRLRLLDLSGADRKEHWNRIQEHDLVLTTYGTLRRDAPLLKDVSFDTVVLDEAQAIKNASSESAKAARLLSATHRLALTGTPIENHLGDLWSLFEFLNPGLLGSAAVFRMQSSGAPSAETAAVLSKALRPFILRRTKDQVARELPQKLEQTIYCELKGDQRKLYNELRDHYRTALLGRLDDLGIQKSRMQILEALLRLRQAACHPGLIDKGRSGAESAKLDALIPQLQEVVEEGHKALVFSQFTTLLAIVRLRLDKEKIRYQYLDGRTRDRKTLVEHFQNDPDPPLFLISLKAGGLGLNLTAAEYVFLLDPWWNPAVEAQAIDRTHRIGQSRPVFAYRLIAKDTVEEKVLELQKSKRELADAIITADNSLLKALDRKTLELLLS